MQMVFFAFARVGARFALLFSAGLLTLLLASPSALAQFAQQGNKLVGSDHVSAGQQGGAVAMSVDGNTVMVGGSGDNLQSSIHINGAIGAVWVYVRANDGVWSQQGGKLTPPADAASAHGVHFGSSVALSADGNTALVGGAFDASSFGAVWVLVRDNNGAWSAQGGKLTPNDADASGGTVRFGNSVALSGDGNVALVGGNGDASNAGAAWIFTRDNNGVWTQKGNKLFGTGAIGSAEQGTAVALARDGNTALVGGPSDNSSAGAIWVFTYSGGAWSAGPKLIPNDPTGAPSVGKGVALSANGTTAMAGGYGDNGSNPGAAWAWTRSGNTWTQQGTKLIPNDASSPVAGFGISVALSSDGNTAIFGGKDDGAASSGIGSTWVFVRTAGAWSQQGNKLTGSNAIDSSAQGVAVALSGNGNMLVTGGIGDNSHIGAAWIFAQTPTVASIVPTSGSYLGGTNITITGTGFTGSDAISQSVKTGLGVASSVAIVDPNHITAVTAANTPGVVDVTVANSIGTGNGADLFTYVVPTPDITHVTPNAGPTTGGTSVTISGTNLTNAGAVKFGKSAAQFTVDSGTHITATTPAHAVGKVAVSVTINAGTDPTDILSNGFTFFAPPSVTGINPNSDYVLGGSAVSIVGTNFDGATAVKFGLASAAFTVDSNNNITATAPGHAAGTVNVVVTTPGGTTGKPAASLFAYLPGPVRTALHNFTSGPADGDTPVGWLVADKKGILYGVTAKGGSKSKGTVFTLSPPPTGKTNWTKKIVHNFAGGPGDGASPDAGLFIDNNGALFGVTPEGGTSGNGIVFRITPNGSTFIYQPLYSFKTGTDGSRPQGGVVVGFNGDVFGTTKVGGKGPSPSGTLYKLTSGAKTPWPEATLHSFAGAPHDGSMPIGRLYVDDVGTIFGTTNQGGLADKGTLFSYVPSQSKYTLIQAFAASDNVNGRSPAAGVAGDGNGKLFGTLRGGGDGGCGFCGLVFQFASLPSSWKETPLHSFGDDGLTPSGVVLNKSGALYGTTKTGGLNDRGVLYKLSPPTGGASNWTERLIYTFTGGTDGGTPGDYVLLGMNETIFGITQAGGGPCNCGAVFMIKQ